MTDPTSMLIGAIGFVVGVGLFFCDRVVRPRRELQQLELRQKHLEMALYGERSATKDQYIGQEFGGYTLDRFLYFGANTRVYRGVLSASLDPKTWVAIRILVGAIDSPDLSKRFMREAEVVSKLIHPSIIRVVDYGDSSGTLYLVTEYITGETLGEHILVQGMSGTAVWSLLEPLFGGLSYLHQRHTTHRNLNPGAILVTEAGRVVLDWIFPEARRLGEDVLVTPAYLSPEQISGDIEPGGGCDQYAIGVMIYEMLTGQLPFPGLTDPVKLLMANLNQKPTPIRQIRADLSQELENALLKMLSKNPSQRFESMSECGRVLEPLILAVKGPGPQ